MKTQTLIITILLVFSQTIINHLHASGLELLNNEKTSLLLAKANTTSEEQLNETQNYELTKTSAVNGEGILQNLDEDMLSQEILIIEDWMIDEELFSLKEIKINNNGDIPITIEDWMTNDLLWKY